MRLTYMQLGNEIRVRRDTWAFDQFDRLSSKEFAHLVSAINVINSRFAGAIELVKKDREDD